MISRLVVPFKDIFTTIFTVETEHGVLIFDTGTYPEDITGRLLPFLEEKGLALSSVKAVFISHSHGDHAGGLATLAPLVPQAGIYTRSKKLSEAFPDRCIHPEDGDLILDVLQVVTVPGHSRDSMGLLDTRTGTLLSGDSLQLYGIFGSGDWASNVNFPLLHLEALDKLAALPLERVFAAHDYHPLGWCYEGKNAVLDALDRCRAPLFLLRDLIRANPALSDEAIAALFCDGGKRPSLRPAVVTAVRNELCTRSNGLSAAKETQNDPIYKFRK